MPESLVPAAKAQRSGLGRIGQRVDRVVLARVLPAGFFALLTGMFWIGERSDYHRLFYLFVAAPTLLALALEPRRVLQLANNGLSRAFMAFAAYTLISYLWSDVHHPSLLKYPFYIFILFCSVTLIALERPGTLARVVRLGVIGASLSALVSLFIFFQDGLETRLPGYGALYNPLLTSHVYGMFSAAAIAFLVSTSKARVAWSLALIPLLALLLATGSRTPLIGIAAVLGWLVVNRHNRQVLVVALVVAAAAAALALVMPDDLFERGLSYRPELWQQAWSQICERIWFGHGHGHPIALPVESLDMEFTDPHNMTLAVFFSGGLVGLALWLTMFAVALVYGWKNRADDFVLAVSAMIVFGFTASMTEGGSFISRPKEHWFLLWIPLALLAAGWSARSRAEASAEHGAQQGPNRL